MLARLARQGHSVRSKAAARGMPSSDAADLVNALFADGFSTRLAARVAAPKLRAVA